MDGGGASHDELHLFVADGLPNCVRLDLGSLGRLPAALGSLVHLAAGLGNDRFIFARDSSRRQVFAPPLVSRQTQGGQQHGRGRDPANRSPAGRHRLVKGQHGRSLNGGLKAHRREFPLGGGGEQLLLTASAGQGGLAGCTAGDVGFQALALGGVEQVVQVFQ